MTIGIYKITNMINSKSYIGQSIDVEERIASHFRPYNQRRKSPLYSSMKCHGIENFKWELLIECTKEELNFYEKEFISKYNSHSNETGYNLTEGGDSFEATEETKKKISDSTKHAMKSVVIREKISSGLKKRWVDQEYRGKLSGQNKSNFINKDAISDSMKEVWNDINYRQNFHDKMTDKWNDPLYRESVLENRRLKNLSPETKLKRSLAAKAQHAKKRREKEKECILNLQKQEVLNPRKEICQEMQD